MSVYEGDRLEWVETAVASILGQSRPADLFVIVIDGPICASTREFLAKAELQHSSIKLVENPQNVGLAASMNRIIELTLPLQPDYFFRMDSDDISAPERFESQIAFLEANPKVDVLGSFVDEIDEEGNVVGQRNLPTEHHQIMRFMPKRCSLNHPSVAIRYRVWQSGHRYGTDNCNNEDYHLWIDLAVAGFHFANINKTLLHFRCTHGFFNRRGASKAFSEFHARLHAMRSLKRYSLGNLVYALGVLTVRFMPAAVLKLAYRLDRMWLKYSLSKK
ncbi:glycosyltransferase [Ferrimonas balearica]|uniref:glycosyltransferase n=1 Tax=Ferrimonas balearica TaxID=44012 RepID=UPI001C98F388|nr:glycosyltransferase [Ferrimonas balearica]MBY5921249.1 glycosyltransferase [Ferrimonas balearica]MBY5996066.1 glycosyltransferase [Ferrimonas balearica]